MGISIGGINLADAIVDLEYQLTRTQLILEWILNNNPIIIKPSPQKMAEIDDSALRALQKKYPEAGIKKTT